MLDSDRGKMRAQITQPYGILHSPLFLPSCLSLQEENHLHSDRVPPCVLSTYVLCNLLRALFSLLHVLPFPTGVPALSLFPRDTQPKLTSLVHNLSAY